jgi:hypothetical protein
MNTLNRVSGTILVISALGIVIGLPIFANIRDSKALKSTAPICAPGEAFEECLAPLPSLPEEA